MTKIKKKYPSSNIENPYIPKNELEKQRAEMKQGLNGVLGKNKKVFEINKDRLDLSSTIEKISKQLDTYWKYLEELNATDLKNKIHNINVLVIYGLSEPLDYSQTELTKEQIKEQEELDEDRLIDAYEKVFGDKNFNLNSQSDRINLKNKIDEELKKYSVEIKNNCFFYKDNPFNYFDSDPYADEPKYEILQESINESFKWIEEIYEKLLNKVFSRLNNTCVIYPAIGGDKECVKIAEKNDLKIISVDPRSTIKQTNNYKNISSEFNSYEDIKSEVIGNPILFLKGFETLVDDNTLKRILSEFDGEYIIISETGHSGFFGEGIPDIDRSKKFVEETSKFTDATKEFFNEEEVVKMNEITQKLKKCKWTSGQFPASNIKIYKKIG